MATEPDELSFEEKKDIIRAMLSGLLRERTNVFVSNNSIQQHDVSTPKSNPVKQCFTDSRKGTNVTTLPNTKPIPTEKHDGQSNTNVLCELGQYATTHEDSVQEVSTLALQNNTNTNPFVSTAIEPLESERNVEDYQCKATEVTTTFPEIENSHRNDLFKYQDSHQYEKNPFSVLEVENHVPSNDRSNNFLGSNKKDFDIENVKTSDQLRLIRAQDTSLPNKENIPDKNNVTVTNQSYDSHEIMKTENNSERINGDSPDQIDLLLIGKTGHGKSALGNSILNRNAFVNNNSTNSVTKIVQMETSMIKGRIVNVVDTPGVGDTELGVEQAHHFIIKCLSSAVAANPRGYHAFLLVIKLGGRLTSEETNTIDFLKKILGKFFLRKFGILVVTCGDQLDKETDFQTWVLQQTGFFADLVKECNNRVILFDNKTKEKEIKEMQYNELMRIIDHLIMKNCRYSNEQFELARSARNEFLLVETSTVEINSILKEIQRLQDANDDNSIMELNELTAKANGLHENLLANNNTGLLKDLISHVETLQNTIILQKKLLQTRVDINKRMEEKELQLQLKYELDMMNVRNDLDERYLEQKAEEKRKHKVKEEQLQKEIEECDAKNKSLEKENSKLFQQLKDIENSHRRTFLSKLQSKIANAFRRKIKEKQLKSQTHFYTKIYFDDEQDDEKRLCDT